MVTQSADAVPTIDEVDPPRSDPRRRRLLVHSLTVFAALLLLFAAANTWVKRQMLDTDTWVSTSDELLANDEIRGALSVFVVDQLYDSVDVTAQIEARLPDNLSGLAAPVAAGLRGPAVATVDRLLSTSAAREVWSRANRRAHETFVNIVHDDTVVGTSTANGVVTLDLREIVVQLADQLGLPGAVVDRIPEGVGSITVMESAELDSAQRAVTMIEWASALLFFLIVGLFGAAVALAEGWRRVAARNVGLAVMIVSLVLLAAQRMGTTYVLDNYVANAENRPVVGQAWWIATELLRQLAWSGLLLGAAIVIAAVAIGPARPAVWLRARVGPLLVSSPLVVWGAVTAVVLLLVVLTPFDLFATGWGVLAITATFVVAMAMFQRTCWHESIAQGDPDVEGA